MLFFVKIHLALIVVVTWLCGFFIDKSVPYFPIEISRTGTGPISSLVFQWGTLSLIGPVLWIEAIPTPFTWQRIIASPHLAWCCIVMIAWFPDHTHLITHCIGVALLMGLILLNVLLVGDVQRRLPIVLFALGVEMTSLILKGFIVLFTEFDNSLLDWRIYFRALFNVGGLRDQIVEHIMNIMFKGTDYVIVPALTVPAFRVTGVMQWLALYLMLCLY